MNRHGWLSAVVTVLVVVSVGGPAVQPVGADAATDAEATALLQAATAELDVSTTTPRRGERVRFEVSLSGLPDSATVQSYEWDFGDDVDGPPLADATMTHAYLLPGTYPVTVTVTTEDGTEFTDTTALTVRSEFADVPPLGDGVSTNNNSVYGVGLAEGQSIGLASRSGSGGVRNGEVLLFGPDGELIQREPANDEGVLFGATAERNGTYYVGINASVAPGFVDATTSVTPVVRDPDRFEPNGNRSTATPLDAPTTETDLTLTETDQSDWYAVSVDGPAVINVSAELPVFVRGQGDVGLQLYGADGAPIGEVDDDFEGTYNESNLFDGFGEPEQRAAVDAGGTYYLRVEPIGRTIPEGDVDGLTLYDLTVEVTEPSASIQAAVDAASPGEVVEVDPGTYRESVTLDKNVTLVAPEGATLNGSTLPESFDEQGIDIPAGVAPTVEGFTVTGYENGVNATGSTGAWTLRDMRVADSEAAGVVASNSSGDWTITGSRINGSGGEGVLATDTEGNWTINGTRITVNGLPTDADGTDEGVAGATATRSVRGSPADGDTVRVTATDERWTVVRNPIDWSDREGERPASPLANWTVVRERSGVEGAEGGAAATFGGASGVVATDAAGNWTLSGSLISGSGGSGVVASGEGNWTIDGTEIRDNEFAGLSARGPGDWTVRDSAVVDNDDVGVGASGDGDWTITGTRVVDNGPFDGIDASSQNGVNAWGTDGDWTISDSVIAENAANGLLATNTSGNWTISNTRIVDNDLMGVLATDTRGDWAIRNSRIAENTLRIGVFVPFALGDWTIDGSQIVANGQDGVSAFRATGDWTISDSRVADNGYVFDSASSGVNALDTGGDWVVRDTRVTNSSGDGITAEAAGGNWSVENSSLTENGALDADTAAVDAFNATGDWTVTESIVAGNGGLGVNATAAAVTGNAAYNYWGEPDGPGGDFSGSGDAAVGNVAVRPYYTDPGRTTLGGLVPVCGSCSQPTDVDGDGLYEDVDGDGNLTFFDVLALYDYVRTADEPTVEPFDFEDDGALTFFDVLTLYDEFQSSPRG